MIGEAVRNGGFFCLTYLAVYPKVKLIKYLQSGRCGPFKIKYEINAIN